MNLAEQRIDSDSSKIGLSDTTGDANPAIVHGLIMPFTLQMATSAEFSLLFVLGFIALGLRICVTYDFRFVS